MERESNFSKFLKVFEYLMAFVYVAFSLSLFFIPTLFPTLIGYNRIIIEVGVILYGLFRVYTIYQKQKK